MASVGRWILGGIAVWTMIAGYPTDWNRTHLFNPSWPPHAKFHDAWTLLLGTGLGASALVYLRKGDLETAALLPALFWAGQGLSVTFPNAGSISDEFPELVPKLPGGHSVESVSSVGLVALTGLGYLLARRGAE